MIGENVSGKVALITGSTKGIGLVTALALHRSGHVVILNSRRPREDLSPVLQKYIGAAENIDYIPGDVNSTEDIQKIFQSIK